MNGGLSAEVDYGAAISPVDCANIVRSGRSTRDGHERGRDNFLLTRFDEQPVLESDLPQIAAWVFQATTATVGLRATSRAGFEHMHVLALAYWHHMHAARLFLAFIHGRPLRATSGRSAYHISGEACTWLGSMARDAGNPSPSYIRPEAAEVSREILLTGRRRDRNYVTLVRDAAAAFNLLDCRRAFVLCD